jgi:pilus assembly protein CpaF
LDLARLKDYTPEYIQAQVAERTREIIDEHLAEVPTAEKEALVENVVDEMFGFGPVSKLLRDEGVAEVFLQGPKSIAVNRNGKVEQTDLSFDDERHLQRTIEKLLWEEMPRRAHLVVRSKDLLQENE